MSKCVSRNMEYFCFKILQVPYQTAKEFADANGASFAETSAVTSTNVKRVFEKLLQEIYDQVLQFLPNEYTRGHLPHTVRADKISTTFFRDNIVEFSCRFVFSLLNKKAVAE